MKYWRVLPVVVVGLSGALVAAAGAGAYLYRELSETRGALGQAEEAAAAQATELATLLQEKEKLTRVLTEEQKRAAALGDVVAETSEKVETLEKLTTIDKELLGKYSKVYFLNEHYMPEALVRIDERFWARPNTNLEIHEKVWPFLEELLEDAERDDVALRVTSAFRSFGTQADLKKNYLVTYGSGANRFSADQGYSEHQLGTTVDFGSAKITSASSAFEATPEYQWLLDNAYKYGFILSYPKGNSYYKFEPWHWRFVGMALARRLHREEKHFYELDQEDIEGYLIRIFD